MSGKEEPLPCVRMTAKTRPQGSPQVSPCPQVSQLGSHAVSHCPWDMFLFPLLNNPEMLQLFVYNIIVFYTISFPSPQVYFILIGTQICCNISHLKAKTKPSRSHIPCSYHPFLCLSLWCDPGKQWLCILSAFSLLIGSEWCYIQVYPPPPKQNPAPVAKVTSDLIASSPWHL